MLNYFSQPKSFYTLFMLEIWERFGYGALVSILVVYLQIGEINLGEGEAIAVFSAFAALVYAFIVLGGYIGDIILGEKRTILLGLILLLIGYSLLVPGGKELTLFGLSFICVGVGLFKSNPSSLLAKLHINSESGKISNAFTLFYMAINVGSLLGMLMIPTIAKNFGYSTSFTIVSIALMLAIITLISFGYTMKNIYTYAGSKKLNYTYLFLVLIGVAIMIYVVKFLLAYIFIAKLIVILTFILSFIIYICLAFLYKKNGYFYKMMLALILMCEAIIYKISYIQKASSINLFTIKNTDHYIFGLYITPESFQSFNSIWMFILSPILAYYYVRSENSRFDISVYNKFSIGLFCIGFAYVILYMSRFTAIDGVTSAYWLAASYAFLALGELLISAIGLSMFAKLAPAKINGFAVGVWWVFLAFASILGGIIAQTAAFNKKEMTIVSLSTSLNDYTDFFLYVGTVVVIISFISFSLLPFKRALISK